MFFVSLYIHLFFPTACPLSSGHPQEGLLPKCRRILSPGPRQGRPLPKHLSRADCPGGPGLQKCGQRWDPGPMGVLCSPFLCPQEAIYQKLRGPRRMPTPSSLAPHLADTPSGQARLQHILQRLRRCPPLRGFLPGALLLTPPGVRLGLRPSGPEASHSGPQLPGGPGPRCTWVPP